MPFSCNISRYKALKAFCQIITTEASSYNYCVQAFFCVRKIFCVYQKFSTEFSLFIFVYKYPELWKELEKG